MLIQHLNATNFQCVISTKKRERYEITNSDVLFKQGFRRCQQALKKRLCINF
jgi:hypothetical protein